MVGKVFNGEGVVTKTKLDHINKDEVILTNKSNPSLMNKSIQGFIRFSKIINF